MTSPKQKLLWIAASLALWLVVLLFSGCMGFHEKTAAGATRTFVMAGTNTNSITYGDLTAEGVNQTESIIAVGDSINVAQAISAASGAASDAIELIGD